MCLCKFETRRWPLCIVVGGSFFVVVAGIVMIAISVMFYNSDVVENVSKEDDRIDDGRKFIFVCLLIFSLVTLLVGGLGFCFCWTKSRLFACLYGLVLLPTWIFILTVGVVAVAFVYVGKDRIEEECQDLVDRLYTPGENEIAAPIDETLTAEETAALISSDSGSFRDQFGSNNVVDTACPSLPLSGDSYTVTYSLDIYESIYINQYMCSCHCPCRITTAAAQWTSLTKQDLEDMGFDRDPESFVFASTGTNYENYKQCIMDESRASGSIGDTFSIFAESFRDQDNFEDLSDWIRFFEEEYTCGGVCEKSLFYWQKSIDAGRPTDSCVGALKDDLGDNFLILALVTLASGVLLLIMFIYQYCLWKSYGYDS